VQDDQYAIAAQLTPAQAGRLTERPATCDGFAAPRQLTGIGEHDHP